MKDKEYELQRAIGIRILEEIDEWTEEYGFETCPDIEMELVQRIKGILKDKGVIK